MAVGIDDGVYPLFCAQYGLFLDHNRADVLDVQFLHALEKLVLHARDLLNTLDHRIQDLVKDGSNICEFRSELCCLFWLVCILEQ